MFRRHLSSIVYLALIITAGGLYGPTLGITGIPQHLPLWLVICVCLVMGVVISILGDVITTALARRDLERQAVNAYEKENGR